MLVVGIILRVILWTLLGLLVLVLLTPVGAEFGYEDGVIRLSAKVWGMKLQLIPKPPPGPEKPKKEKKAKKEKKPAQPQEQKPKKKRGLPIEKDELPDLLLRLLRAVLRDFGRFGRKFRVDRFRFCYLAAGHDPYNVAVSYGWLNAALSSLAPLCRRRFAVKDCEVRTDIDFTADWPQLDFALAFSIRIGQLIGTGLSIGFHALRILVPAIIRKKRADKRRPPEPSAENAPAAQEENKPDQTESTETTEEEQHG